VKTAPGKAGDFVHEILAGNLLVIRKNPHVTNAGLKPNC